MQTLEKTTFADVAKLALLTPAHFLIALGYELFPHQHDIIKAVLTHERTCIKGCHASSKTCTICGIATWWVLHYGDALVLTTAPTLEQVKNVLWTQIGAFADQVPDKLGLTLPPADRTQWRLGRQSLMTGRSTNKATNMQGFHSDHVLLIIDEAPGLEADLWEALEGIAASGNVRIVMLGNPTIASGMFYDAFGKRTWYPITLSALQNPNVTDLEISEWNDDWGEPIGMNDEEKGRMATLLSMNMDDPRLQEDETQHLARRAWIRNAWFLWGKDKDQNWYSRVLGQFPPETDDMLISRTSINNAKRPTLARLESAQAIEWGIDVAGPGDNETVLCAREGDDLLGMWHWKGANRVKDEVIDFMRPYLGQTTVIKIDSAGIGYYFAIAVGEAVQATPYHVEVVGINVGRASTDNRKYANLRAELSWELKQRFDRGRIAGIFDETLRRQLASLKYSKEERGGIIRIEPKEKAKERGVHYFDRADALTLAFASNGVDQAKGALVTYELDEPEFIVAKF